jgi:hypothetical protein
LIFLALEEGGRVGRVGVNGGIKPFGNDCGALLMNETEQGLCHRADAILFLAIKVKLSVKKQREIFIKRVAGPCQAQIELQSPLSAEAD